MYWFIPLTIDITTISVVVAMTTPSRVRKERILCERSASTAIQKASRAVTHILTPWRSLSARCCNRARAWLSTAAMGFLVPATGCRIISTTLLTSLHLKVPLPRERRNVAPQQEVGQFDVDGFRVCVKTGGYSWGIRARL